ncbi:Protein argonaute 2 [Morella rubra]|uniref:Protein argonaute 2 n=1 Tax=Morella rubra TaxID=262757 RepID=A0A6A1WA54_9ROSI|nr:Protein argonaute 2 [Morella rubra]
MERGGYRGRGRDGGGGYRGRGRDGGGGGGRGRGRDGGVGGGRGRGRGGQGGGYHHQQEQGRGSRQGGAERWEQRPRQFDSNVESSLRRSQAVGSTWVSGSGEGSSSAGGAWKGTTSQDQSVQVGPTSRTYLTAARPVQLQPQRSSPEPVPGPAFQELQKLKISESPLASSHPEDTNKNLPMKRPDKGGTLAIRPARLCVNHFPVKFGPQTIILHYDVDIKPEVPRRNGRLVKVSKSDFSVIRNKLSSDDPVQFPLSMTAYDGEKNIFSAVPLPTGRFNVKVPEGEDTQGGSYIVAIKLVNELKLCKLKEYLSGCLSSIPRDILQGLDLVMKENPARNMIPVGRIFFPYGEGYDLKRGIMASRGFQHSLKPTSQGLAMCLDYSVLPFLKPLPVIDFLKQHISGFDINNFQKYGRKVHDTLKDLKVTVTHRKTKQKYVIRGLADQNARQSSFNLEDPDRQNPPRRVRLVDYFREKYDKDIKYKDIPCLDLGKGNKMNYVPMEFCLLVVGQRYPKENLDKNAALMLKGMSLVRPEVRQTEICNMVRSEDGPCGGVLAQNFGLEVNMNMTTVTGRVIGPPELKLGAPNGGVSKVTVDKEKCQWNLVGRSVVEGKRIDRWGVVDFRSYHGEILNPDRFIPRLIVRCKNLGIHMAEPIIYEWTEMDMLSNVDRLRELLESINAVPCKDGSAGLQFLLCAMSSKDNGYKNLKWVSETQVGIVTQCCLSYNANKANDQYLANLAIKINAKLGGSNIELNQPLAHFGNKGNVMFVGADVNHPASRNFTSPSIAAVVATMNWPAANRYAARVCPQEHRKEKILNFGETCLELVESFARFNNVRPDKIVVFRDGVSESQFDMVLNEELVDLKRALERINYSPTITLIVAQKRHQTRFFPASRGDGCSTGNVYPGTVVDTIVVHPFEFDFYLCSHYGSIGTSKPTHYHVLWDEHRFTSDLLQKLIYDLCFTFARCTKPVSLVPPVYYADLVAYRGRLYYEAMEGVYVHPGTRASSSTSLASSASPPSQDFYKLHAGLENIMFFV